mgnify:FL=1
MNLKSPLIVNTIEECVKLNTEFKRSNIRIKLDWYIDGTYELPLVIYSDSGNYDNNENYLHSSLNNLSKRRQSEIRQYIKI